MANYFLNGKATVILLIVGIIQKNIINESIFSKTKPFEGKCESCFFYLCYKSRFKSVTVIDTSKFAKKTDIASLKSDIHMSGIHKVEKVSTGLNRLKSKADKLDVHKLVPVFVDFYKNKWCSR